VRKHALKDSTRRLVSPSSLGRARSHGRASFPEHGVRMPCVRRLGWQRLRVAGLGHGCTHGTTEAACLPHSLVLAASACRSTAVEWFVPFSGAGLAALVFRSSRAGWLVLVLGAGLAAPVYRVPDLRLWCLGDLAGGPISPAPGQLILLYAQVCGSLLILRLAWLPCSCTASPPSTPVRRAASFIVGPPCNVAS
jgi:hypothetical protein